MYIYFYCAECRGGRCTVYIGVQRRGVEKRSDGSVDERMNNRSSRLTCFRNRLYDSASSEQSDEPEDSEREQSTDPDHVECGQ